MPNLNVVIPSSLATILNDAVTRRASSLDSVVTEALSQYFEIDRHRAYQISTSAALVQGAYDGAVSSRTLLAHGDFGLGSFEHLDGEMVVLDGDIYQVRGDGSVQRRQDNFCIPFAVVSRFQPDESFDLGPVDSLEALAQACDPHRESDNLFYALSADGFFARMHTRAVKPAGAGTGLAAAAQTQPEFHFTDIRDIKFLSDNKEAAFFGDIEKFRFADHGRFDVRGDKARTVNGTGKRFSDSNQRNLKGFVPTFSLPRDFKGFVGRLKLDWFFIKPAVEGGKTAENLAPWYARTMVELNKAPAERISDHAPITVDLPLTAKPKVAVGAPAFMRREERLSAP